MDTTAKKPVDEQAKHEQSRLQWRCRRGMLELDLLLQKFLARFYSSSSAAELAAFEELLTYSDPLLLDILLGKKVTADQAVAKIVERVRFSASH